MGREKQSQMSTAKELAARQHKKRITQDARRGDAQQGGGRKQKKGKRVRTAAGKKESCDRCGAPSNRLFASRPPPWQIGLGLGMSCCAVHVCTRAQFCRRV